MKPRFDYDLTMMYLMGAFMVLAVWLVLSAVFS
jgi:hypothetical protein